MEDRSYYTLNFYYEEERLRVKEKKIVCDMQEKEKFELFLISSSNVTCENSQSFYFERNDLQKNGYYVEFIKMLFIIEMP